VLNLPVVHEVFASNLLEHVVDHICLLYLSCIAILATILDHVFDTSFHGLAAGGEFDDGLILLNTLLFKISLINVKVKYHLEECFKCLSGAVNAFKGIEAHWLHTLHIEGLNLFDHSICLDLHKLKSFFKHV